MVGEEGGPPPWEVSCRAILAATDTWQCRAGFQTKRGLVLQLAKDSTPFWADSARKLVHKGKKKGSWSFTRPIAAMELRVLACGRSRVKQLGPNAAVIERGLVGGSEHVGYIPKYRAALGLLPTKVCSRLVKSRVSPCHDRVRHLVKRALIELVLGKIVGVLCEESGQHSAVRSKLGGRVSQVGEKILSISILSIASGPPTFPRFSSWPPTIGPLAARPSRHAIFLKRRAVPHFFQIFGTHALHPITFSCIFCILHKRPAPTNPHLIRGCHYPSGPVADETDGKRLTEKKTTTRVSTTSDQRLQTRTTAARGNSNAPPIPQPAIGCLPARPNAHDAVPPRHDRASEIQEIWRGCFCPSCNFLFELF